MPDPITTEPFVGVLVRRRRPEFTPPGYVPLIDAVDEVGRAITPHEWDGSEKWARNAHYRSGDHRSHLCRYNLVDALGKRPKLKPPLGRKQPNLAAQRLAA